MLGGPTPLRNYNGKPAQAIELRRARARADDADERLRTPNRYRMCSTHQDASTGARLAFLRRVGAPRLPPFGRLASHRIWAGRAGSPYAPPRPPRRLPAAPAVPPGPTPPRRDRPFLLKCASTSPARRTGPGGCQVGSRARKALGEVLGGRHPPGASPMDPSRWVVCTDFS